MINNCKLGTVVAIKLRSAVKRWGRWEPKICSIVERRLGGDRWSTIIHSELTQEAFVRLISLVIEMIAEFGLLDGLHPVQNRLLWEILHSFRHADI